MIDKTVGDILVALVPVIISGLVAVVTSKQVADLKDALAVAQRRIVRLEQILVDHDIPVPPAENGMMFQPRQ